MENKNISDENLKEKTRKYSIIEGSFASVAGGIGDNYVTPYALALNASNAQIGFLSSFAGLIGPISQIFGSRLMEKYDRRKLIWPLIMIQASAWLLFVLAGFFFIKSFFPDYIVPFLIISYILYVTFGSIAGPPWFSLMGDAVPEKIRGKYFSKRNRINGAISIIIALLSALWLDYIGKQDLIIYGFMLLFIIAFVGRSISAYFLSRHYAPKMTLEKGYYFSLWQFIKKAPYNNFGRFAIFIALINLTVNIAGPFFAVYMLKEIGFNYIWFTIINISSGVFSIMFLPLWGKFADKYGNRETLRVTSFFIPLLPIFWLFSESPVYLIFVPQLIGGIAWAGFNLAASNFIYDAVTVQRRGIVVAYYSVLNGAGIFIGALLGGLIAEYIVIKTMSVFFLIFLISGIARAAVTGYMLPKIEEVRKEVTPRHKNPFLYLKEIKPLDAIPKFRASPLSSAKALDKKS